MWRRKISVVEKDKADWSEDVMQHLKELTPEQFEDMLEEMEKYIAMAGVVSAKESGGRTSFQSLKRDTGSETTL